MSTPLKRLRKARGLTAATVAAAVGINQGQYSRIENGAKTSADTAQALVQYFGRDFIDEVRILYPDRFPPAAADPAPPSGRTADDTPIVIYAPEVAALAAARGEKVT